MSAENFNEFGGLMAEITNVARGIARCLSYNGAEAEAQAKHMLLEMANYIDVRTIRTIQLDDGRYVTNALGQRRLMTETEIHLYEKFDILPQMLKYGA